MQTKSFSQKEGKEMILQKKKTTAQIAAKSPEIDNNFQFGGVFNFRFFLHCFFHGISLCVVFCLSSAFVCAASFIVTNADNAGAGSLRQAILDAAAAPGDDEIYFDETFFSTPQTITLSAQLLINGNGNLLIEGPGADLLEIINPPTPITSPPIQALRVEDVQLIIRKINLRGFYVNNGTARAVIDEVRFNALGLVNFGNTSVYNSAIENCGTRFDGGGVLNGGTLIINRSTISGNSAIRNGGGIANTSSSSTNGILTVNDSIISNNRAFGTSPPNPTGTGGGVYLSAGMVTINRSLIRNNQANDGGGVFGQFGSLVIYNSTVTANSANGNQSGNGAGIRCPGSLGGLILNSTVYQNVNGADFSDTGTICAFGNSIFGTVYGMLQSRGFNIIGNASNAVILGVTTGNQLNVNPLLFPLADNGGGIQTFAPMSASTAINAGSNALANNAGLTRDQRGSCFRRIVKQTVDIGAFEVQAAANPSGCNPRADFDGDGRADISVFRPANGTWYWLSSANNSFNGFRWGLSEDKIAPADFDGDGKTDVAVFRPSNGFWYRIDSSTNGFVAVQFGISEDIPVAGDFDGDFRADISVFRPSNGSWYRINSSDSQFVAVSFGAAGDKPQVADFDGDGKTDIAVWRPATGFWYLRRSQDDSLTWTRFGLGSEDIPTAADYDGDGRADVSVFRRSNGYWFRFNSSNNQFVAYQFGATGDIPAVSDFDGDGRADISVFRPSNGTWYQQRSTNGFYAEQFGTNGDIPITSAFVQ